MLNYILSIKFKKGKKCGNTQKDNYIGGGGLKG